MRALHLPHHIVSLEILSRPVTTCVRTTLLLELQKIRCGEIVPDSRWQHQCRKDAAWVAWLQRRLADRTGLLAAG